MSYPFPLYAAKITELAGKLGIRNTPRLNMKDLSIAQFDFSDEKGVHFVSIEASEKNKGACLFFEPYAQRGNVMLHLKNPLLYEAMRVYFAEPWEEPLPSGRPFLDALRTYAYIQFTLKY